MADLLLPKFYPPQIEFLNSKRKYNGYGGARGGGKSFVARYLVILKALKYPGIQILMMRRTFPELRENHIIPMRKILFCDNTNPSNRIAIYKTAEKVFVFPNGSRIVMGYCDSDNDVLQYQGQSYDIIFMEEATQFTEFQYSTLTESNRLSGNIDVALGFQPCMYFTMNPGSVGHQHFKRLFIDKQYREKEVESDYSMIRSQVYDNVWLMANDPDYVRALENLPENRRRAMLDGDWDAFEGQFFPEFDRSIHVCEPFVINSNWRIYRTRDYGLDMCATYWIARAFDGTSYVFREFYESNLIVSEAGKKINDLTEEKIYMDLCPPDLFNRNSQTGKSAADIFYSTCGHRLTEASNDRVNGWLSVKEMLACKQNEQGVVVPKLIIFKTCTNLIRCLPQLIYDSKHINDASTEPHEITHAPDALRYYCASWTFTPTENIPSENVDWIKETIKRELKEKKESEEGDSLW